VRLVAIAKDRDGSDEFTQLYWPKPAEIYFDTTKEGYPFFGATNGREQGLASVLVSFLFGGQVKKNFKNAENIPTDMKGEGASVLGSLVVVSRTGEVLFHHKEKVVGDQPDPVELKAAIKQLGEAGVAECECSGERTHP